MGNNDLSSILQKARARRMRRRVMAILSAVVLLVTSNQFKQLADTLERYPTCGMEEHLHTAVCFDDAGDVICGQTEHVHTDACYQDSPHADDSESIEQELFEETIEAPAVEAPVEELEDFDLVPDAEEAVVPEAHELEEASALDVPEDPVYDYDGASYALLSDILNQADIDIELDEVEEVGESIVADNQPLSISVSQDGDDYIIVASRDFADDDMVEMVVITKNGDIFRIDLKNGTEYQPTSEETPEEEQIDETEESTTELTEVSNEEPTIEPAVITAEEPAEEPAEELVVEELTEEPTKVSGEEPTIEPAAAPTEELTGNEEQAEDDGDEQSEADAEAQAETGDEEQAEADGEEQAEADGEEQAEADGEEQAETDDEEQAETDDEEQAEADGEEQAEADGEEQAEADGEEQAEADDEAAEEAVADDNSTALRATIDLTDMSAPFSLRQMMEEAAADDLEVDTAAEEMSTEESEDMGSEDAGEAPSEPADWKLEYDTTLFDIVFTGEDYLITPQASFDTATIRVEVGDSYVLTLIHYELPILPISYPAQNFEGHTQAMTVRVTANEGAFPEGTTMEVVDVAEESTLNSIVDAVEDHRTAVNQVYAVDITFRNADGEEIEPLLPISVVMTVNESFQSNDAVVVHMDDTGNAEKVEQTDTAETSEVAFDAETFSIYAVVVTEKYISADGETWNIQVSYNSEAGIPEGAALRVDEVEAPEYLEMASEALGADKAVKLARFFDITILADGQEIQPDSSVTVKVALNETVEADDVDAVHFGADGVDVLKVEDADGVVTFNAESFSVYGIVYTVDFHYEINGQMYDFSLPGGEKIALSDVVEVLGIYRGTNNEENGAKEQAFDSAAAFMKEVADVGFSDESLVKVARIEDDWILESLKAFDTEEALTITMKNGDVVTVIVTDAQIKTYYLSDSGELYEVTVTYGDDAQIPDGATLKVTEFSEGSKDYTDARKAVLADMLERGESIDLGGMGLAALDISILDADGNEIEPAAPVQVDMTIKALPGVDDLSKIADTLTVKHHVETEDGVVIEKVFDGGTEAEFDWNTDEAVAAEGVAVDPDSVDMSAFEYSSFDLYDDGSIVTNRPEDDEDDITLSFQTPVFSTFTVNWSNYSTVSNQLRVSGLSNGKYILYARDAANGSYYALVPGTSLNAVQVTLNGQLVQYSGSENLYWDVEVSGDSYYFSFTENGKRYYLAAGTTGNRVQVGTSKTAYGNANTTGWQQWSDYIHSAGDTFLQSYNGVFRTWNVRGIGNWGNSSLIYFEKEGATSGGNHATIHYVDEAGNELTVSNGQPVSDTNNGINYLIYDIDGYEYAYTYRNSNTNSNRITPALRYNNNCWQYTTGTDRDGNNAWNNLSSSDDIYVVYKQKTEPPTGGTPVPKITGEKPETPTITKSSTVNGDGTNTLALSVTGHTSIMEAEKLADVIVIYDVSGSMNYRMDSETNASAGQRRMDYAQAATKALAESLLGKNTTAHPELIRMALISFSNSAQKVQDFTTDKGIFNTAVNNLPSPEGGTNWEQALQIANEMAVESDRATFVVFVTDGNPTFRMTRGTLHNDATDSGLGVSKAGDPYWSYDVGNYYYRYNVYGGGNNDEWGRNYAAALTVAQSIVDHNKNFYTIGISNDVTNLTKLTTEAGAGADHSKTATSEDELIAAFDDIAASIIALMGHSDVQISDGITALTQTVQKSTLVNFAEDDFVYSKERLATAEEMADSSKVPTGAVIEERSGSKYVVWNNWDPTSEGCAEAVYNTTTGAVEWNMGETFMLEDGVTYQVRFKVWPSQEAYDLLADLNNGVKNYASLSDAEKAQIKEPTTTGGMYTLKTNSDTSYSYREATKSGETVTPIGDPSTPGSFPDVDPLELTTRPLKVKKQWHNNYVDSRTLTDSITMELYGVDPDGVTSHDFKEITLTKADGWYAENNYVSYGLVTYNTSTNAGAKIYETGHDFTLRETDSEAHYYELTAGVYRPMFINGTPTILEQIDEAPEEMSDSVFHYAVGSHHYYRLDGKIYQDTESDILMIATNSHRSFMDLTKVVVDESGTAAVDDTEFEYHITFTVPEGIANYETMEKYIWFSVYDPVSHRTLTPETDYAYFGAQTPASMGKQYETGYDGYLVAFSGEQLTLKIKQGWNVRFLNLANGTIYSFEEVNIADGYTFVSAEVSGTRWEEILDANGNVQTPNQGEIITLSGLPVNNGSDPSNTAITGTIDYANARYKTTYTNRTITTPVKILKTNQDGSTPLPGAVFSLYTESGYGADPKQAVKTGLTSGADGIIDLGGLTYGKYYLVEDSAPAGYIPLTDPVVITVASTTGVSYKQSDSSLSQSGNGVNHDPESDVYTLTVTNNAGYELPSTGGPGTRLFTILGSLLILGAGVLLLRRRRTI